MLSDPPMAVKMFNPMFREQDEISEPSLLFYNPGVGKLRFVKPLVYNYRNISKHNSCNKNLKGIRARQLCRR